MGYGAVDSQIDAWANRHRLSLHREFGGVARRFCYVTAGEHECFQVSIEPLEDGLVTINARDIETQDDAELSRQWEVVVRDLDVTLEAALAQISEWSQRTPRRQWGEIP